MPLKSYGNVWSKTYNYEQISYKINQENESSKQSVTSGGHVWPGTLGSKQIQEGYRFNNENKNKKLFIFEIEGTSCQSKPMMTLGMDLLVNQSVEIPAASYTGGSWWTQFLKRREVSSVVLIRSKIKTSKFGLL